MRQSERGAVLVEASIYFPLVICTVIAMIYLGLFHMQEAALSYVAERAAIEASRGEAYLGYRVLGMNAGRNVDFAWEAGVPPKETVTSYYEAYHARLGDLYREVGMVASMFAGSGSREAVYEAKYAGAVTEVTLLALGHITPPEVTIERGFFSSTVTVTITHTLPMPKVVRYLGVGGSEFAIETRAVKQIVNPGEFVRNVDLAADLLDGLMEKLGVSENYHEFLTKTKNIMEKILG